MATWTAGVVGDRPHRWLVGRKNRSRPRVRLHWRHFARAHRVRDWGMDLHQAGNRAREYVFVFAGSSDGWSGPAGVDCASVFWWREGVGRAHARVPLVLQQPCDAPTALGVFLVFTAQP